MATVKEDVVHLKEREVGIFGFGSLLSVSSLERTLGEPYQNPTLTCTITGWRRRWNITEPNEAVYAIGATGRYYPDRILFLNIEPRPNQVLNGLLAFIDKSNLPALDRRENVYDRIDITQHINEYRFEGGSVYTYEGKKSHVDEQIISPREAAVQKSYLDTIEQALQKLGRSFRKQYEASTDEPPRRLVIRDRIAK